MRFPYPGRREKYPEASKSAGAAETVSGSAGEKKAPNVAKENTEPKATKQVTAADSSDRELRRCPACGSMEYHRTKRTSLERLRLRPPMARCEKCRMRFPYPGRREKYPEASKSAATAETVSGSAGEKRAPNAAEENTEPKATKQVTAADSSDRELRRCPACGSTEYHRTKRTSLERLRLRPPMARCEKCRMRFPYPGRREKYPGASKLAGAAETVSGSAGEKRAPNAAEENTEPKATKQVTAADSSDRELRRCPACGSTSYSRSRRTALEHLLLRPPMARCKNCRRRFPYPKR
jgi:hypothetical protein